MQTLTFTQKLLRQRRFLSSLIPLLALFLGLGASQSAMAQVVLTPPSGSETLLVDRSGTGGGPNTTYTATAFDGISLGSYNINTGVLNFNGGSVSVTETSDATFTYTATSAVIEYAVVPTGVNPSSYNTLILTANTFNSTTGVRTFTLTNAQINLIRASAISGAATYDIDTRFFANFTRTTNSTGAVRSGTTAVDNNGGFNYTANFIVTGTRPAPTNISNTTVIINPNNTTNGNTTYNASAPGTPKFDGASLGTYDVNTGQLILNGGTATTFESGGDQVAGVTLFYRVYKDGQVANIPPFSPLALQQTSVSGGTRQFSLSTAQRNLIANLANSGIGTYNVQVYYQADVLRAAGNLNTVSDDNGGNFYRAQFNVNGTPILINTWTGKVNDDWFTAGNWSLNAVPNANTNVAIPDFGAQATTPYPNINSGNRYTASNGVAVDNTASGPAICRDLFLQGGSQAARSICRVIVGRLKIYGNFSNQFDSFIMRDNTVVELAGVNQEVSGGSGFTRLVISGGGTKFLPGSILVTEGVTFDTANGGGLFTTDISQPTRSFVELADRLASNNFNGAQLDGETETSYLRGFMKSNRANVLANEATPRTYGNMGLTLRFTGANNPGDVLVTRNTQEGYTPINGRSSVRRIFGVRPSSPNTNSGGLQADMTFRYLDNETVNLGPSKTASIPEQNLTIFVSNNSGNTFGLVGRDGPVDQTNNIVTKTGYRGVFATFTLGDIQNPLPVRLTAFDAKRIGSDALVTWQTATEENSKGYEVQVSTNGTEYRTLAFITSASPNTTQVTNYSYVDKEANKTGKRYYRLHQMDLDGKDAFFAPTVVSFDGKAPTSNFVAYPNPLNGGSELHVALQSAATGTAKLLVTDMTGRTLQQQNVVLTGSLTDTSVAGMGDLKAGLYLVKITLPTGEVKNLKVVKQ